MQLKNGCMAVKLLDFIGLCGEVPVSLVRMLPGYYDYNRRVVTALIREGYLKELLSHHGLLLAPGLPNSPEPHCCQQAGRAAVEPQCFLPAAMSVLWSQRMAVDALRPSGTDPLELFRSQFRQAQGANDSASTPLALLRE